MIWIGLRGTLKPRMPKKDLEGEVQSPPSTFGWWSSCGLDSFGSRKRKAIP